MAVWAYARYGNFTIRMRPDPDQPDTGPHPRSRWTRASQPPFTGAPRTFTGCELELVDITPTAVDIVLRGLPIGEWAVFDDTNDKLEWIAGVPADDVDGIIMDGTPFERPILHEE